MSHDELRMARRKAVGTKQTIKALERGVLELCKANGVEIIYVDTMAQLGKACGIEVGAASVAILVS